ncbi:hypothetical protein [Deinococcus sp. DB0503]|uniref:hypothetical protein n=1 Tax=Deinococcus sp. DB0503 TaxID=2479203 RepID=UPI0018E0227C|nr:hypothetical protein [Deinococcus sp. DB0503]MBI0447115.1 hypothetical protein [Deinococcus sp. DB0503]
MKRPLALLLTTLALASGVADAARRSGGGFGGSRRSGGYSAPRYTSPSNTYTAPRTTAPSTRTPSTTQRNAASGGTSAVNRAAASRVTPSELNAWKNVKLPAGVPRRALTYSATPSAQYPYQLAPGRYFPYPQSYYRSHGIGTDILKYALIFTAASSIANALDGPDVIVNGGVPGTVVARPGPNLWTYAGVGLLAAAAAWFWAGRRRR